MSDHVPRRGNRNTQAALLIAGCKQIPTDPKNGHRQICMEARDGASGNIAYNCTILHYRNRVFQNKLRVHRFLI